MDPMYENEVAIAKVEDKGNGNYFIDLGKEIVGGLRLTLNEEGVAGTDITILYGEELLSENSVKWKPSRRKKAKRCSAYRISRTKTNK
jgi:hypothetical protein